MIIDLYHQLDEPTGLHIFLGIPAGKNLDDVPLILGIWEAVNVQITLNPLEDMTACDDLADRGWSVFGSAFIGRLSPGTTL